MENGIRPSIQMAVDSMRNLRLGHAGEQHAQLIRINVASWLDKWPDASINLMLTLPGEKDSYPAKTVLENGELLFLPGLGDTQRPGNGAAYVVATIGDTHLAASATVITEILIRGRGGDTLPEAPEAQAGWVAEVLGAADRAEEAAENAEEAAERAEEANVEMNERIASLTTPFSVTGNVVICHPVKDYPLNVITHFHPLQDGNANSLPSPPAYIRTLHPVSEVLLFRDQGEEAYSQLLDPPVYGGDYHWGTGSVAETAKYRELDGSEAWDLNQNGDVSYFVWYMHGVKGEENKAYMSHYANRPELSYSDPAKKYNVFRYQNHSSGVTRLCIRPDLRDYDVTDKAGSLAKWKAYLAAQKAAGTPVQIVYFLAQGYTTNIAQYPGTEILSHEGENMFSCPLQDAVTVSGPLDPAWQNAQQEERIAALEAAILNA